MPWGKGSITPEIATGLRCKDRQTGLSKDASNTQIFYNLGMDRVHYVPQNEALYFVNSEHFKVLETIENVYRGLGQAPRIEQLYLDAHGYYNGALLLQLSAAQAPTVLTALRLSGIKISIANE